MLTQTEYCLATRLEGRVTSLILLGFDWLPPRDSNPDMLIQSQLFRCRISVQSMPFGVLLSTISTVRPHGRILTNEGHNCPCCYSIF